MKRLHTGEVLFDTIDVISISLSAGSGLAYIVKFYKKRNGNKSEDTIIAELKEKSPITIFSKDGEPVKSALFRGEDDTRVRGFSGFLIGLKNKKLVRLLSAAIHARKKKKQLRLRRIVFFLLNKLLTYGFVRRIAVGGPLGYTEILLLGVPSTIGSFVLAQLIPYPIVWFLIAISILSGRSIEYIPNS